MTIPLRSRRRDAVSGVLAVLLLSLAAGLLPVHPAQAKRVALVIGNAAYANAVPLRNARNDATAVTSALRQLGFEVGPSPLLDADNAALRTAIAAFRTRSEGAALALLFYAGHAVQVDNGNHLVPVDGRLRDPADLDLQTVRLDTVLGQMRGQVNLLILDACRDNPFADRLAAAGRQTGRSLNTHRGLARIDAGTLSGGALLAMAAAPDAVADDGSGQHSPYTTALLRHLQTPDLPVRLLFARIRETVEADTNGRQRPETIDRLPARPIYLVQPTGGEGTGAAPAANTEADRAACTALTRQPTVTQAQAYLARFPDGPCADLAAALGAAATAPEPRREEVTAPTDARTDTLTLLGVPVPEAPHPLSAREAEDRLGLTRNGWRQVQTALNRLGYGAGVADGIPGGRTRAAIERWQRATDRTVESYGYLTAAGLATLSGARPPASDRRIWQEPVTGLRFVRIPGGRFDMGCGAWGVGCTEDARPVHRVSLDAFWMSRTEVTQDQWRRVMGSNPAHHRASGAHPVEQVSWNDIQGFLRVLNRRSPGRFRLPTEAEWEYACRGGGRAEPFAGGDRVSTVAWYYANSDGGSAPVGGKPPNALGLYDMSGNVWEWVQDWYAEDAYRRHAGRNPVIDHGGGFRVRRGGSWGSAAEEAGCSARSYYAPRRGYRDMGFRLVRAP